jgi:hypothetical protein
VVWIVPVVREALLLVALAWELAPRTLERIGHRRTVALNVLATISLANVCGALTRFAVWSACQP